LERLQQAHTTLQPAHTTNAEHENKQVNLLAQMEALQKNTEEVKQKAEEQALINNAIHRRFSD